MTSVKWKGELSVLYVNQQGVGQGGVLSADLYKVYDDQLDRLQNSGKGSCIGTLAVGTPKFILKLLLKTFSFSSVRTVIFFHAFKCLIL